MLAFFRHSLWHLRLPGTQNHSVQATDWVLWWNGPRTVKIFCCRGRKKTPLPVSLGMSVIAHEMPRSHLCEVA